MKTADEDYSLICWTNFHFGEKAKVMRFKLFTNISH